MVKRWTSLQVFWKLQYAVIFRGPTRISPDHMQELFNRSHSCLLYNLGIKNETSNNFWPQNTHSSLTAHCPGQHTRYVACGRTIFLIEKFSSHVLVNWQKEQFVSIVTGLLWIMVFPTFSQYCHTLICRGQHSIFLDVWWEWFYRCFYLKLVQNSSIRIKLTRKKLCKIFVISLLIQIQYFLENSEILIFFN